MYRFVIGCGGGLLVWMGGLLLGAVLGVSRWGRVRLGLGIGFVRMILLLGRMNLLHRQCSCY